MRAIAKCVSSLPGYQTGNLATTWRARMEEFPTRRGRYGEIHNFLRSGYCIGVAVLALLTVQFSMPKYVGTRCAHLARYM